jgi:hypothetical protein
MSEGSGVQVEQSIPKGVAENLPELSRASHGKRAGSLTGQSVSENFQSSLRDLIPLFHLSQR